MSVAVDRLSQPEVQDNPYAQASSRRKLFTLIGIYIAALATRFISTGSFTVWPMAAADIGGMEIYPLASNVAGLLSICAMPIYGYAGSRYPALKRTLLIGSLLLGAVVLFVIALAPNMFVIIVVNFFYGVVSASIFVVAFSLIRDMYSAKQAGVYLGVIGTMTSIGMLVGPALMGIIIDTLGWRATFHVGWPLLLLAVAFILLGVRVQKKQVDWQRDWREHPVSVSAQMPSQNDVNGRARNKPGASFDTAGAFALTLFLVGLVLSLSLGYSYIPFGSSLNNALLILSAASLAALVFDIRKKRAKAFIPSTVLKDRNTVVLALCNLFCTCSTMALSFFMPAYILNVLGGTALQAGLATAAYAVLGVFICPVLGRIIARQGTARGVFNAGMIVRIGITVVFILLLNPDTSVWAIYVLMLVAGFYSAQQNVTFSTAPQIQIRKEIRFQANSVVQTSQNLGSSIGIAVYTAIMALNGIAFGMPIALIVAGATAVIALVIGQFLTPVPKEAEQPQRQTKQPQQTQLQPTTPQPTQPQPTIPKGRD